MPTDSAELRTESLVVAVDFTSADSYLALDPAIELANELKLGLSLQPFRVPLTPISAERPNENDTQRHKRIRAQYRQSDTRRYAQVRGIELLADPTEVDPTLAHLGLILATDHGVGPEFAQVVFRGLWTNQIDVHSEDNVLSVLRSLGVECSDPLHLLGPKLSTVRDEMLAREVFSVPTFLIRGERFIGRQHFSMIRNLLEL